jgi:hypothetical protein
MFSIFTNLKIFFSSSPLILLYRESVNSISWINIKISTKIIFVITSYFCKYPCFRRNTGIIISVGYSTGCLLDYLFSLSFLLSDSGP